MLLILCWNKLPDRCTYTRRVCPRQNKTWKPELRKPSDESLALQTNKGQWEAYRTLRLGETGPAGVQMHGSKTSPFLGTPLSSPGYFQFRSPPTGEPQADKTFHFRGLLESSRMDEGFWEWHLALGVIWCWIEIRFKGWERRRKRTSLAELSYHCGEWKEGHRVLPSPASLSGVN